MLKRADLQLYGEFYYTGGLSFEGSEETSIVLGNNFENTQVLRTKQRDCENLFRSWGKFILLSEAELTIWMNLNDYMFYLIST